MRYGRFFGLITKEGKGKNNNGRRITTNSEKHNS